MKTALSRRLGLFLAACLLQAGLAQAAESQAEQDLRTAARYIQQRDYQQALAHTQKALALDPKSAKANSGMGNIYAAMHQYGQAIPYLETALRLHPNDPTALYGLGACYMDLQQHEQAIPYLEKAVKIRPREAKLAETLAVAYVRRGAIYGRQGQQRKARASIHRRSPSFKKRATRREWTN